MDVPPGLIGDVNAVPVCSEVEFSAQANSRKSVARTTPSSGCSTSKWAASVEVTFMLPSIISSRRRGRSPLSAPVGGGLLLPRLGSLRLGLRRHDLRLRHLPDRSVTGSTITFWGVPADPSHDPFRGAGCLNEDTGASKYAPSSGAPLTPLLTLPTSCTGPLPFSIAVDSWASPGLFATDSFLSHDNSGNPIGLEGCDRLSSSPNSRSARRSTRPPPRAASTSRSTSPMKA